MNLLERMKYRIDIDPISSIPQLKAISDHFDQDVDPLIKWVVYRYDPNCEPIRELSDQDSMNLAAAEMAEINDTDPEWDEIFGEDRETVEDITTMFLRSLNNSRYSAWVSGEIAVDQVLRKIRDPITSPPSADGTKQELDADREVRAYLLKTQLHEKVFDMINRQEQVLQVLVAEDPQALQDVINSSGRIAMTPEARAGHVPTG